MVALSLFVNSLNIIIFKQKNGLSASCDNSMLNNSHSTDFFRLYVNVRLIFAQSPARFAMFIGVINANDGHSLLLLAAGAALRMPCSPLAIKRRKKWKSIQRWFFWLFCFALHACFLVYIAPQYGCHVMLDIGDLFYSPWPYRCVCINVGYEFVFWMIQVTAHFCLLITTVRLRVILL